MYLNFLQAKFQNKFRKSLSFVIDGESKEKWSYGGEYNSALGIIRTIFIPIRFSCRYSIINVDDVCNTYFIRISTYE